MFKRFRKGVAAAVACVFVMGIAAYAQTQAPAKKSVGSSQQAVKQQTAKERAAKPQAAQQKMQRGQAQAGPEGMRERMRERAGARMGSLIGLLTPPSPEMVQRLAQRLGLTDQQKEQIKQLYAQFMTTVKPIREQRMAAIKAFMVAFRNPNVSKAELQRLSEPVLQGDRALLDAEFDFWLAFRSILRPEQQAQLQSLIMKQAGLDSGDRTGTGRNQVPPARTK